MGHNWLRSVEQLYALLIKTISSHSQIFLMATVTCIAATLLALLFIPFAVLLWLTESKNQKARRWRKAGATYKSIGERLGCSATTAKRWSLA